MNLIIDRILEDIADAPGDLRHVPPALQRAVVTRAVETLHDALIGPRAAASAGARLERYTVAQLVEEDWLEVADGGLVPASDVLRDAEGTALPRSEWEDEVRAEDLDEPPVPVARTVTDDLPGDVGADGEAECAGCSRSVLAAHGVQVVEACGECGCES